jgi:predicted nucleotidyltransferase
LADYGMRTERPPEGWLLKAWDGDVLVDLIWDLEGLEQPEALLARAEELSVHAVRMPVLRLNDVVVSMLCAFDEHELDFAGALAIARALREQVDWRDVRERTARSPYARGFLGLLEALEIVSAAAAPRAGEPRVRVVPGG